MTTFVDNNELVRFARNFVQERVNSLEKDVTYCLLEISSPIKYAPFPALLYCFSTVNLLGALLAGDASRKAQTTTCSKNYMRMFMNYSEKQSDLLIDIYRHKLVHLAQPRFVYHDDEGKKITWQYHHDDSQQHLIIEKINITELKLTSTWNIPINHVFHIGIMQFMRDIKDSVEKPQGYLHMLEITPELQDRLSKAIEQIHQD